MNGLRTNDNVYDAGLHRRGVHRSTSTSSSASRSSAGPAPRCMAATRSSPSSTSSPGRGAQPAGRSRSRPSAASFGTYAGRASYGKRLRERARCPALGIVLRQRRDGVFTSRSSTTRRRTMGSPTAPIARASANCSPRASKGDFLVPGLQRLAREAHSDRRLRHPLQRSADANGRRDRRSPSLSYHRSFANGLVALDARARRVLAPSTATTPTCPASRRQPRRRLRRMVGSWTSTAPGVSAGISSPSAPSSGTTTGRTSKTFDREPLHRLHRCAATARGDGARSPRTRSSFSTPSTAVRRRSLRPLREVRFHDEPSRRVHLHARTPRPRSSSSPAARSALPTSSSCISTARSTRRTPASSRRGSRPLELVAQRFIGGGVQLTAAAFRNRPERAGQRRSSATDDRVGVRERRRHRVEGFRAPSCASIAGAGPTGQITYSLQTNRRPRHRRPAHELAPAHGQAAAAGAPLGRRFSAGLDAQYVSTPPHDSREHGAPYYAVTNVSLLRAA